MQALEPFVAYAAPRVDQATREGYLQAWRTRILEIAGAGEDCGRRNLVPAETNGTTAS
jgi:hypothetical protein